jgi:hypothetical protein
MLECSIKGCEATESELLSTRPEVLKRWVILMACRCGAYDGRNQKPCSCRADNGSVVPTTFWPNLDWWMLGGVEKVVLCPDHKTLVAHEIDRQRQRDPSMDSGTKVNPTNKH